MGDVIDIVLGGGVGYLLLRNKPTRKRRRRGGAGALLCKTVCGGGTKDREN